MRLEISDLAVARGETIVFQQISFALGAGEGLLVTGPNGAGKSTLLRAMVGFLPLIAGFVRFDGGSVDGSDELAAHAHYLGPNNGLKGALTVEENFSFFQKFCGAPLLSPHAALDKVGLAHVLRVPFSDLSTGQRRRVAIARLFLNYRPVWLLDEPTSGLDAASEKVFAQLLAHHLEAGGIVVAATHLPIKVRGMKRLRFEGGDA